MDLNQKEEEVGRPSKLILLKCLKELHSIISRANENAGLSLVGRYQNQILIIKAFIR